MLNGQMDAATAAFEVGYESPSPFSRESIRLFGAPPIRDIESLGGEGGNPPSGSDHGDGGRLRRRRSRGEIRSPAKGCIDAKQ